MSIDKNTNEGKNYRNNVVKSTSGTSKSRINTGFPENISVLSPMMKEYVKTKEEYSDCILFYRLGDFYEMFFEDALTASRELEITLTGKDCGLEERAPMCGVPFHAAESYIETLVKKGYKVLAIDFDPQGSLTESLGYQNPDELEITVATILHCEMNGLELPEGYGILHHEEGIDILPANIELSGVEVSLVNVMSREYVLKQFIKLIS